MIVIKEISVQRRVYIKNMVRQQFLQRNFLILLLYLPFPNLFDTEINWISCLFRLQLESLILISDFPFRSDFSFSHMLLLLLM